MEILRLMRDDDLATLDQDIVVARSDPESARLDYRRHIAEAERRQRFLAPLIRDTVDEAAVAPSAPTQDEAITAQDEAITRIARGGAMRSLRCSPVPDPTRSAGVPPVPGSVVESAGLDLFERFVRDLPGGGIALDVGCGAGAWTARLAGAELRTVGLDASPTHLDHAAMTLDGGDEGTLLVEADPMELPLAAASVDGVWCAEVFASVRPDRRAVFFRQINRVLRPGGLLYLGAATAPPAVAVRRYLLWRYAYRCPVEPWEIIAPPGGPRGRRYVAAATPRGLHEVCAAHGFKVLVLRRVGERLLLLARKERGTDADV